MSKARDLANFISDNEIKDFKDTFQLPSTDGTDGQALITDGNGNITFGDVATDGSADGGFANSTYLKSQSIDGGNASG